jgi:hypothetical protein
LKQAKNLKTTEIKKKDIFKYLDCEEILPSLLLFYLVFQSIFSIIERLQEIFNDLIKDCKQDIPSTLLEIEDEREKYIETKRKEKELDDFSS